MLLPILLLILISSTNGFYCSNYITEDECLSFSHNDCGPISGYYDDRKCLWVNRTNKWKCIDLADRTEDDLSFKFRCESRFDREDDCYAPLADVSNEYPCDYFCWSNNKTNPLKYTYQNGYCWRPWICWTHEGGKTCVDSSSNPWVFTCDCGSGSTLSAGMLQLLGSCLVSLWYVWMIM